jgi:O-Antigen ligase
MSRTAWWPRGRALDVIRSSDRLAWVAFSAWAIVAVAVVAVRPGFLLETATAGIAGTLLWSALRDARPTRSVQALAVGCALVPLVNTWPARVYHSVWESRSLLLAAVLSLSSLVAGALVLLVRPRMTPRASLATAAALLSLAAAVASTTAAGDPTAAAAGAWSVVLLPVAFGVIVATVVRSIGDARLVLTALLAGALVPATAGIAAYVLSFGVPWTLTELAEVKAALFRTHLFQEITFGNVGHLADFALLLLPAALLLPLDREAPRATRLIAAIAAVELTVLLLLVLSRGALMIAAAVLAITAVVAVIRRSRAAVLPTVVSVLFVAVLLSSPVRGTFEADAPAGTPVPNIGGVSIAEPSAVERIGAVETGLRIAREHLPWGVGSGRYLSYDPIHTAPHSLWIAVVVELGVLGLAALALVVAIVAAAAWWLVRRPHLGSRELVLGSAVAGAGAFLGHGIAAGAPLAVGRVNVWAVMLAVLVMLAAVAVRADET